MEARELRIGNLIQKNGYVFTVEEILGKDNCVIAAGEKDISLELIESNEQTKPIILTEEWLVKFGVLFGFNHCGSVYDIEYGLNGYNLRLNYDVGMSKYIGSIKHVHQLQNLYYALTGEHLVIQNK
mgnify:CR=1 FL=1